MITCPKCSKENQDHYKFCLGCGAELPRENAPKPFSPKTPPHGVAAVSGADAASAAPAEPAVAPKPAAPAATPAAAPSAARPSMPEAPGSASPAPAASAASGGLSQAVPPAAAPPRPGAPRPEAGTVVCPQCQHVNSKSSRFCASCGYNLAALSGTVPATPSTAAAGPQITGPVTLTALRADGSEAGSYQLPDAPSVTVGRDTGSIFAGDSYLSPRHATFIRRDNQLLIKDEGALNGVYLKLKPREPWPLEFNDIFRIGQEIIRFEPLKSQSPSPDGVERFGSPAVGYIGRLALVIGRDTTGNAFPIPERGVHCGRERGDILFSDDGYVSGLHCQVAPAEDGKVYLTDVGSSNGTFVRLRNEHALGPGDILLMGQQLFRVDI